MGIKDIFVKNENKENEKPKETPKKNAVKFPNNETNKEESSNLFSFGKTSFTPPVNKGEVSQEHIDKALQVYKDGFDSLNQDGYDFYEFYQMVMSTGPDNAQTYVMAYTMAKAFDKSITKEKFVQQAEYYISEITKNYENYVASGNAKKQEAITQKEHENESLVNELDLMRQELEQLKIRIADRESKLKTIGSKHDPKIAEIESKLSANETAKNQIIESIDKVKQGIINNVK